MSSTKKTFFYGEDYLTAGIALAIARGEVSGVISEESRIKINQSRSIVEAIVEKGEPVYGINTGFGPLCTTKISRAETRLLQENILKSHSVGVGEPVTTEIATLMMILKVHALSKGFSGVAEETLDRIIWHIENCAIPIVPSQGSVGASGDLAPLSHLFLPLIGLGKVLFREEVIPTAKLFAKEKLKSLSLGPKEGLALINGTQFIAANAIKIVERFHNCLSHADIIGAMMIEGLQGSIKPFLAELHQLRPYKGNIYVAARIKGILEGSGIMEDHVNCEKVQDPYSLRCMPQVHGASRTAWLHLKELLEIELNSVTDNPVVFNEELTISGGNFHGQPLAIAIDYATIAISELGNISDRRVYLALEGNSPGIPKLLMKDTGINSGYMILQYTTAALASENKGLCFPSSADSIPTSLGQEDHVSMGSIGSRKALKVVDNVEKILAIEMLTAAQAFEFRKPLASSTILEEVHKEIRKKVPFAEKDRVFADDIEKGIEMVKNQDIVAVVNKISIREGITLSKDSSKLFDKF
jgi:histidine ammonia-lyase